MPKKLESLWAERYREDDMPPRPKAASKLSYALETMLAHRSVRAFLPDALPEGVLEWAIAAASSASTSSNMQAWSVIAIRDPAMRDLMAQLSGNQEHVRKAPVFLAWVADLSRLERAAQREDKPDIVLDYLDFFLVSVVDAALAAQNAAIAFEAAGLGINYIGGIRSHVKEVAAALALPPRSFVAFGMCVGWPDPAHPASIKPRLPQSVVLHDEKYGHHAEAGLIDAYDLRASAFQQEQNLPPRRWTAHAARQATDHAYVNKRKDLHDVLRALGFPLT